MNNELSNSLLKEVVRDILHREGEKRAKLFIEQLEIAFKNKGLGELGFDLQNIKQGE